jgi:hypothetical protein
MRLEQVMGMLGAPSSGVIRSTKLRSINRKLRTWRPIEPISLPMRPMNGEPLPGSAGKGVRGWPHNSDPDPDFALRQRKPYECA